MKEYKVSVLKSDNVFAVKASWSKDREQETQVDYFGSENEAIEHAQWWTNKSGHKNHIVSVEVTQVIRYVVAK
tara:strand:+ start:84 stop:302 length:219 start_codon:yes stop_codon:yes gene_type:complete